MDNTLSKPAISFSDKACFGYLFLAPNCSGNKSGVQNSSIKIKTSLKNPVEIIKIGRHEYSHYLFVDASIVLLTLRQAECLQLLSCYSEEKVAKQLGLAPYTIYSYSKVLKKKLNCQDKHALNLAAKNIKELRTICSNSRAAAQ
jgi:DNA-binding CsgD family transcriptional regulator